MYDPKSAACSYVEKVFGHLNSLEKTLLQCKQLKIATAYYWYGTYR